PKQLELVKKQYQEDQAQYVSSPLGQVVQQIEDSTIVNGDFARMQSSSAFGKVTSEDVEQVYQKLYQQRHHNSLIIAGNIDPQEITTLLRQYIANIPLTE
ncbi:insulinase family protein, partial [Vibrio harveyi]|uniref:insulinase family protein n=1 Tax=Vibrio harveyi TaxID=669 RepID=UPI0018F244BF